MVTEQLALMHLKILFVFGYLVYHISYPHSNGSNLWLNNYLLGHLIYLNWYCWNKKLNLNVEYTKLTVAWPLRLLIEFNRKRGIICLVIFLLWFPKWKKKFLAIKKFFHRSFVNLHNNDSKGLICRRIRWTKHNSSQLLIQLKK